MTSAEIIDKFGDFDRKPKETGADGLYRDCNCDYFIRRKGSFEERFRIYFNEEGIAYECGYELLA